MYNMNRLVILNPLLKLVACLMFKMFHMLRYIVTWITDAQNIVKLDFCYRVRIYDSRC